MNDSKKLKEHLLSHQDYPASKKELLEACGELSDVDESEKKQIVEKLPEGNYDSAQEVIMALGL